MWKRLKQNHPLHPSWKTVSSSEDAHCPAGCASVGSRPRLRRGLFLSSEFGIIGCSFLCALTCTQRRSTWQAQMADTLVFSSSKACRDQCTRHFPPFFDLFPAAQAVIVHTGSNNIEIKRLLYRQFEVLSLSVQS